MLQDLCLDSIHRGNINFLLSSGWNSRGEWGCGRRSIEDVIAGLRLIKSEWNRFFSKLDALQLVRDKMDRLLRVFAYKKPRPRVIGSNTAVGQPEARIFVEFPVFGLDAASPLSGDIPLLALSNP